MNQNKLYKSTTTNKQTNKQRSTVSNQKKKMHICSSLQFPFIFFFSSSALNFINSQTKQKTHTHKKKRKRWKHKFYFFISFSSLFLPSFSFFSGFVLFGNRICLHFRIHLYLYNSMFKILVVHIRRKKKNNLINICKTKKKKKKAKKITTTATERGVKAAKQTLVRLI